MRSRLRRDDVTFVAGTLYGCSVTFPNLQLLTRTQTTSIGAPFQAFCLWKPHPCSYLAFNSIIRTLKRLIPAAIAIAIHIPIPIAAKPPRRRRWRQHIGGLVFELDVGRFEPAVQVFQ